MAAAAQAAKNASKSINKNSSDYNIGFVLNAPGTRLGGRGGGYMDRMDNSDRAQYNSDEEEYDDFGRKKKRKKPAAEPAEQSAADKKKEDKKARAAAALERLYNKSKRDRSRSPRGGGDPGEPAIPAQTGPLLAPDGTLMVQAPRTMFDS